MTKNKMGSMLMTFVLIILCLLLINYIYFRFIASYTYNEERLNAKVCQNYVKTNSKTLLTPLNSFMYKGEKLYSCAINDIYEKVIVVNQEGRVILEGNYRTLQHSMDLVGVKEVGMYQNQLVLIDTQSKEQLEIKYYDMKSGEEVFSLQPKEKNDEENTME